MQLINLRVATPHDLDSILNIESDSFDNPWLKKSRFLEYINKKQVIVATKKKSLVGFLAFDVDEKNILIVKTATLPDLRGNGVGTSLLNYLKEQYPRNDEYLIYLHVRSSNNIAISFYNNNNFKVIKKLENYYKKTGGESAYRMACEI